MPMAIMLNLLVFVLSTAFLQHTTLVSTFKITGATGGIDTSTGASPSRLEINDFAVSGPAFDLYILSLQQLQAVNQTDQFSYFQIAGIHGYPPTPWDSVTGHGRISGYCMHFAVTFPLWHRPYLALFEQLIWTHAQSIAISYPPDQRAKYQAAALTLRIPYWDWAIHPSLPNVVTTPTIHINSPGGWQKIKNPLFNYEFHPGSEGNGFPANSEVNYTPQTVRGASTAAPNVSNEALVSASMQANAANTLSLTYQLLASPVAYSDFSCVTVSANGGSANSIEAIHNNIHVLIGGSKGAMLYPEIAAFDPIFWLHHAQVDRLVSMWQILNPSQYIVPMVNSYGSYYEAPGTLETVGTSLAPFRLNTGTSMYTPQTVRDIATFGYTYPELARNSGNLSNQQADLRSDINQLYNPNVPASAGAQPRRRNRRMTSLANAFTHVTFANAQQLGINNLEIQWSIRVSLEHCTSNEPFAVDFFMGEAPARVAAWATANNLVGTYGEFRVTDESAHRSTASGLVAEGEVSLTHVLAAAVSRGFLTDLSSQKVIPVLRGHLNWRVRTFNDEEVCSDRVPGLSILVQSRAVKPRGELSEFPVYGDYVTHPDATAGKNGGDMAGWQRVCNSSEDMGFY